MSECISMLVKNAPRKGLLGASRSPLPGLDPTFQGRAFAPHRVRRQLHLSSVQQAQVKAEGSPARTQMPADCETFFGSIPRGCSGTQHPFVEASLHLGSRFQSVSQGVSGIVIRSEYFSWSSHKPAAVARLNTHPHPRDTSTPRSLVR